MGVEAYSMMLDGHPWRSDLDQVVRAMLATVAGTP
jgi:hypothetical protein